MRLLVCATAVLALGGLAVPAQAAATKVVFGYAWADGRTGLRLTPATATYRKPLHKLTAVRDAKELRLDYGQASYRRVTVACDLKETEGKVAIDRNGLGTTPCKTGDLTETLAEGPSAVRVEYSGGKAVKVSEILSTWPDAVTARGTIRRAGDSTVLFTTGGRTVKLGYTHAATFSRTTARCSDSWLAGKPVNVDKRGLGKKACSAADLAQVLKTAGHPVLAQIEYVPGVGEINQVWEVYGTA
ncbi:hypothetical protein ABT294_20250 [Nonomuraea sp. NPDC000554]|uniref:hypothetical protein n=1 Tax=Nonomuraea sp. NPDC000554 TaxID=3154259 RepID=UPI00331C671F